jgi:hypothetical protein
MLMPSVTEITRRLEPVARDSFIDDLRPLTGPAPVLAGQVTVRRGSGRA